jgi:hypothetical protein
VTSIARNGIRTPRTTTPILTSITANRMAPGITAIRGPLRIIGATSTIRNTTRRRSTATSTTTSMSTISGGPRTAFATRRTTGITASITSTMTRSAPIRISRPGSPISPRAITIGSPSTGTALNARGAQPRNRAEGRAGALSSLGPISCPYSPECVEYVFLEVHIHR